MKQNFYVTFGVLYAHEVHPKFAQAHPDGWLRVVAENEMEARLLVVDRIGHQWSFMYVAPDFMTTAAKYFPRGELDVISSDEVIDG